MKALLLGLALSAVAVCEDVSPGFESSVIHGYADSAGVKIHYASVGSGPLVVMIHGFPDYWYTWRHQMEGLKDKFQMVAIDQRGYNLSDKPEAVSDFAMRLLAADVVAVIRHLGKDKAIIVGHDWGGAVAWALAINAPQSVEKLIILNLPHPRALARELANNPEQQRNSAYARRFQNEGTEKTLTAESLAAWVKDADVRRRYVQAFQRSSFTAMLNYYRANYPREPYQQPTSSVIKVQCPVLMIHGLKDKALLAPALNDTWDFVQNDFTLTTLPDAGHFVQADAADFVTRTMRLWLLR